MTGTLLIRDSAAYMESIKEPEFLSIPRLSDSSLGLYISDNLHVVTADTNRESKNSRGM